MMAVTRIALLFFLALLLSCGDSASRSVDIAIEHVTLVDAINPIRENQTVLIDDGRIVAIVDSDTQSVSARKPPSMAAVRPSSQGCGIFMCTLPLIRALPTRWLACSSTTG